MAVGRAAVQPVHEQLRALHGVRREEGGDAARDGVPAPAPELRLVTGVEVAEVPGERVVPRLVEALVDHLEQRPGERVGRPRVVVDRAGELGDERTRRAEVHPGADAVERVAPAEPVREPLAEPPLDAAGRHQHQLRRERVLQRARQQVTELVGEQVGARGAVEVERHGGTLDRVADNVGGQASQPSICPTCSASVIGSNGLEMTPEMASPSQTWRSPTWTFAVTRITGMCRMSSSACMCGTS